MKTGSDRAAGAGWGPPKQGADPCRHTAPGLSTNREHDRQQKQDLSPKRGAREQQQEDAVAVPTANGVREGGMGGGVVRHKALWVGRASGEARFDKNPRYTTR